MQRSLRFIKCTCRGYKCRIVVVEEFWPAYLLIDGCWATGYSNDASVPIYFLKFIMGVHRYCFCFKKKIILFIHFCYTGSLLLCGPFL